MKQMIRNTMTAVALAFVCLAGAAQAQVITRTIKAHIPFEFKVGTQTFPAGEYSITEPVQNLLVLRNEAGQNIASTFTNGVDTSAQPANPELRFYTSGGQHVLEEVWQPDQGPSAQRLFGTK